MTTGIKGLVEYGEGDCMPMVNAVPREYNRYNGNLYFVVKAKIEGLKIGDNFDSLIKASTKTSVRSGKLNTALSPNTYVVLPNGIHQFTSANTVTITGGEIANKNFKFWKCTSY